MAVLPILRKHQRQPLEGDWRWFREIIYCLELHKSIILDLNVTICGSAILEEGEKLKKIGLECPQEVSQQSCLISKEKDKSVMSFFLLLGSIRDNLLRVTGVPSYFKRKIFSVRCGEIIDCLELHQSVLLSLQCYNGWICNSKERRELEESRIEVFSRSFSTIFLIPNEKDRTVMSFFLFLGSIRDNP
ncbi:hypothetical protein CEXT_618751 [Caerostris extrusa]|uniref:Uncharacterized protein n=1 Tax=Caerostris extrusa TaxID=172846 RepID=A0AAV4WWF5_CAEEX|nr:hypothetical protein CEXT_618751 [Caerostris extrusa]